MADTTFGKNGWTAERIGSLKGKTFLITGASSGTGFEAAKILASKNAKVVMLNRNPHKSADCIAKIKEEVGSKADVTAIRVDLGEQASVKTAVAEILEKVDHIDALLCNGAYPELMCATEPDLDEKGFYGPTGRSNWVGPVGRQELKPHAVDKKVSKRLWDLSEQETGCKWDF